MNQLFSQAEADDHFDETLWSLSVPDGIGLLDLSERSLQFLNDLNQVLEELLPEISLPGWSPDAFCTEAQVGDTPPTE